MRSNYNPGMTDGLTETRELVRLLGEAPLSEWPAFEVTPVPFTISLSPTDPKEQEAYFAELKAEARRLNNDLALQAGRVRYSLDRIRRREDKIFWWPEAPMRVAIILRKRGETELEKDFLTGFVRQLPDGVGAKYRQLVERLEKLQS